jgi:hypothetical protein
MDNIVERLRNWGHPDWFYVNTDLLSNNLEVRMEAAEEIERLRAMLRMSKYTGRQRT